MKKQEVLELVKQGLDRAEGDEVGGFYFMSLNTRQVGETEEVSAGCTQRNTSPLAVLTSVLGHIMETKGHFGLMALLSMAMSQLMGKDEEGRPAYEGHPAAPQEKLSFPQQPKAGYELPQRPPMN